MTETIRLDDQDVEGSPCTPVAAISGTHLDIPVARNRQEMKLSPLSISGIIVTCLVLLLVVIAAIKTYASHSPTNSNWEADADTALYTGAMGLVLFLAVVPLQFVAFKKYLQAKKAQDAEIQEPGPCLGVSSWVTYASCAINGIFLVSVGASDDPDAYVAPEWILGTGFWGVVSWLLMFFYSEKARKL